jgi:hypothetical protein
MAKLRVKTPDGKTLAVVIPPGTDPSQYDGLASAALAHYRQNMTSTGEPKLVADEEGNAPVGEDGKATGSPEQQIEFERSGFNKFSTAPVEQRLAENAVEVGNAAGMASATPGLIKGVAGLGLKGLGAITKGLAGPAEDAANFFGSRVLNFSKGLLPKSATAAAKTVDDATEYAMNPHPEVQNAIRQMNAAPAEEAAAVKTGKELVPTSQSLVKDGANAVDNAPAFPTADAMTGVDELGNPILSMSNPTTAAQLAVTESHLGTVGKSIENTLKGLDETGNLYDPKSTVEQLASMYSRNASGQIIPPGSGSQQALYNQAVNRAIETLKANALDKGDVLTKLSWEQANGIKKALQDLAEYGLKDNDPVNMVYQQAARAVRDSIDDQATSLLAAQGKDVAHFQTLRDSYSKLKSVQSALNGKALSAMGAKNVAPVVRTGLAVGALTTGHPLVAAGVGAEYLGREFGPIMAARALKNGSQMPAAASALGESMTQASGGVSNAAKGVAAGLALDINEDD